MVVFSKVVKKHCFPIKKRKLTVSHLFFYFLSCLDVGFWSIKNLSFFFLNQFFGDSPKLLFWNFCDSPNLDCERKRKKANHYPYRSFWSGRLIDLSILSQTSLISTLAYKSKKDYFDHFWKFNKKKEGNSESSTFFGEKTRKSNSFFVCLKFHSFRF